VLHSVLAMQNGLITCRMKYSKKEIMVIFPREVQNQVQG